jgi:glucose-1-phosphate thymidylyltransferase
MVAPDLLTENAVVIPPCFIGEGVTIRESVVGPFVSIEKGALVEGSVVRRSILRPNVIVRNAVLDNCMLGESAVYEGVPADLSISDHSTVS